MDIKEFDLIYNKASPLLRSRELGSIIEQVLDEEQVAHSVIPPSVIKNEKGPANKYQANMTHKNPHDVSERKRTKLARKSVQQNSSKVNKDLKRQCGNAQTISHLNLDSEPVCTSSINRVSTSFAECSSCDPARISRQSTHPYRHLSSCASRYNTPVQATEYSASISKTGHYLETTSEYLERRPSTGSASDIQEEKTFLKNGHSDLTYSRPDRNSFLVRSALCSEHSCIRINGEDSHANSGKESVTKSTDISCDRQKPNISPVEPVSTCGYSIQEDPYKISGNRLKPVCVVDSLKADGGKNQDKTLEVSKTVGEPSHGKIMGCRNDNHNMTCKLCTSGGAHYSSAQSSSISSSASPSATTLASPSATTLASPYRDNQVQEPEANDGVGEDKTASERKSDLEETEKTETDKSHVINPVEIGRFDIKDMKEMVEQLVKANQCFTEFPRKSEPEKQALIQEQNRYLEKKRAQTSLSISDAENDKEKIRIRVLEHSVKYIEMRIAESVRFAKKIPGFLDLPLEDQANLIRESRTESGIVGGMRGINAEKGVFSTMHGATFSMEDMKLVFDETLLYEKMVLSRKIAKLNMSLEEEAILRAITITATDRCKLLRRDRVEDIHNKLISCLLYVISEKGAETVSRRLCKLFDVLMSCRYVTEVDLKQVKKIFLEWPSFSNYKLAEEFL